ncbi:GNAT family N-acetyltransferase [Flavobacterium sp. ZT3R18]|uniref:GNAT family N-acetyltransferase n=1 Tax=Flavobacterium sp. ZT3R18 TaxID=2594429 RepID=UPI00117B2D5C|nr:GNAT family N-acetyltransferase [Flavobacterium sp. ZT3R18]TRX36955.1 GNAT family N-acetyltransferase [Flavobacterium sp. ZT3R18]
MTMIEIKKATLSDLVTIQNISKQSFTETFAAINTPENMKKYLQESFNTAQLTAEINNPDSPFYIAFWNTEPVGYLKLNLGDAQTEMVEDTTLEIQRIYVLQAFHGKKIGQLLLDEAIKIAQQIPVNYIWLGVWEENNRALQFYTKNGFITFDKHLFLLGDDQQTDLLMKLKIS